MSINFSNTTPAAPAGTTNVSFAADGSGNMSANIPKASPLLTADNIDLTAQAANVAAANLIASASAGLYRVTAWTILTQAATTSSVLATPVITWTDNDNSVAQTFTFFTTGFVFNTNTTANFIFGEAFINAKAATAIQYATSGYSSTGATPMQYALHVRIEQMF